MRKVWIGFGLLVVLGGVAFVAVSWWAAVRHSAPVPFPVGPPPADFPVPLESVTFETDDGLRLKGWYGAQQPSAGVVILLHSYRAGRWLMLTRAQWYAERGFSVLLYDARATGESEGDRISLGWHETRDLLAAINFVRQRGETRIIGHGISQGGATLLLAADRLGDEVQAIIVESTYDTLINAGDRRFRYRVGLPGAVAGFVYRPFMAWRLGLRVADVRPIDGIARLTQPVLVMAGSADRHTWESDTRRLYAAARGPARLWIAEGAAHEDLLTYDPEAFLTALDQFLQRYVM